GRSGQTECVSSHMKGPYSAAVTAQKTSAMTTQLQTSPCCCVSVPVLSMPVRTQPDFLQHLAARPRLGHERRVCGRRPRIKLTMTDSPRGTHPRAWSCEATWPLVAVVRRTAWRHACLDCRPAPLPRIQ